MSPTVELGERTRPVNWTGERVFFGGMSLLMIALIVVGFRTTYFPLGPKPADLHSWVIVLHGSVFSLWVLMFFVQTALVTARRIRWHMSLGLAVYGLAVLIVPLGVLAAADELRRDLATGPPWDVDPLTFSMVSVMGMVMFGTLIGLSYVTRRRPDVHKRLALYATLSMMDAGASRFPWEACGLNEHTWAPWAYTGLLLLPVAYDLLSRRKVLWTTALAAVSVWTLNRLEMPLGNTAAWHGVSRLMLRFWH